MLRSAAAKIRPPANAEELISVLEPLRGVLPNLDGLGLHISGKILNTLLQNYKVGFLLPSGIIYLGKDQDSQPWAAFPQLLPRVAGHSHSRVSALILAQGLSDLGYQDWIFPDAALDGLLNASKGVGLFKRVFASSGPQGANAGDIPVRPLNYLVAAST